MALFVAEKPDFTRDDTNYKNLNEKVLTLQEHVIDNVNELLLFDGSQIQISSSFSQKLSFTRDIISKSELDDFDCHDTVFMIMNGTKRKAGRKGPFIGKELNNIGYSYVGNVKIETGEKTLLSCMDRIFARDKLVKEGKLNITYNSKLKKTEALELIPGDMFTFSMIINGGHSMIYLGKNNGNNVFLSKLGVGQLSIHSLEEIYEYYGLSEAFIYRKHKGMKFILKSLFNHYNITLPIFT